MSGNGIKDTGRFTRKAGRVLLQQGEHSKELHLVNTLASLRNQKPATVLRQFIREMFPPLIANARRTVKL